MNPVSSAQTRGISLSPLRPKNKQSSTTADLLVLSPSVDALLLVDTRPIITKSCSTLDDIPLSSRKRVHFNLPEAEVVCHVPSLSSMSYQERKNVWYQTNENAMNKSAAKAVARSIREEHRGIASSRHNRLLSHNNTNTSSSYSRVIQQVYGKYHIMGKEPNKCDLNMFNMWVSVGHSRRGLEVLSVPGIAKDQEKRRRQVIQDVVAAYNKASKSINDASCLDDVSVRAASEKLTLPAKKYALALGTADALAVGQRDLGISRGSKHRRAGVLSSSSPEHRPGDRDAVARGA